MKRITQLTTTLLSSLLVLLGFGGCRTSKKATKTDQPHIDTIYIQTPPEAQPIAKPDDREQMRLLYGPPPTRFRE